MGLGGHGGGLRGSGEGGAGGLDHIGKSHVIWVDLDLLPPLTKFPGSAHGGGGNLFHALEQYQARGDSITARGLGLADNDGFHMA